MIPCFVEQLMYKCANKRCRQPVHSRGHCNECASVRRVTLEMARKRYTPMFINKGQKIPEFVLPDSI